MPLGTGVAAAPCMNKKSPHSPPTFNSRSFADGTTVRASALWESLVCGRFRVESLYNDGNRRTIVVREQCTEKHALTMMERTVAELAATGATGKLIAIELGISEPTVSTHLKRALGKLGIASRVDLSRIVSSTRTEAAA